MTTLAYLGPPSTWSESAALLYAGKDAKLLPMGSIPAVVSAVETGLAEQGVLPVENSLEGAVGLTLDVLIHETELPIVAEVVVPVQHLLLAKPETSLSEIQIIRSHPQALAQCRRFIERVLPNATMAATLSTTAAVEEVLRESNSAAIGTPRAADLYPVQILARNIQDKQINETRFLIVAQERAAPTGSDKTSICFAVRLNQPGSLITVLQEFAARGINLAKLESRPARERLGQYIFLCDIEGHHDDPKITEALEKITTITDGLKVFGSYPVWQRS
jgi:prephenate dehydratase